MHSLLTSSVRAAAMFGLVAIGAGTLAATADDQPVIGERPAIPFHMAHRGIISGRVTFDEAFNHGKTLFEARFNALDGVGRPATTGGGAPRAPVQPAFTRVSGPDASACAGCHNQPRNGGAGDFVANVFVLAQTLDPVAMSIESNFSNERNSLGMMGAGAIELLAREMSTRLIEIRENARVRAVQLGRPVTRQLKAKSVDFGRITVLPDGRVDPSGIEGVDWDLIVKPFHQKGAVVSLREFTNNALNHHHGIQSTERFGVGTDPDGDGVVNEASPGDVTALTLYQAALNIPVQVLPENPLVQDAITRGRQTFIAVGCADCHRPALMLDDTVFTEPNPFNPPGNLRVSDVEALVSFDLTTQGEAPRLERLPSGRAVVRAFTDLKRHDLCDDDFLHFANEHVPQGSILGSASASEFTIAPYPRPLRQFLTRKLWDAGNTGPYGHRGDLTTLTEAIYHHGGEARTVRDNYFALSSDEQAEVIEFLKSLQVVPPQ